MNSKSILSKTSEPIKRFLARNRLNRVVKFLGKTFFVLYKGFENLNYDISTNGEESIIRALPEILKPKVIFDVGANQGEWTRLALRYFPDAQYHLFEIVPSTCERCRAAVHDAPGVFVNNVGLGEEEGEIPLFLVSHNDRWTSAVASPPGYDAQTVTGKTITGDDYCRRNGISKIDFIKIDVEGFENSVLAACRTLDLESAQIMDHQLDQ